MKLNSPPRPIIHFLNKTNKENKSIKGRYNGNYYTFYTKLYKIGGFSNLYKGKWNSVNVLWKVITDVQEGLREIKALQICRKNNIKCVPKIYSKFYLKSKQLIIIVIEFIEGKTLNKLIHKTYFIDDTIFLNVSIKIVKAIQTIHNKAQLAHRDIKSENIILNEKNGIIIIDFGMAVNITNSQNEFCGTEYYMAPEIFNTKTKFLGYTRDIWSLGIVLWEMMIGKDVDELKYKCNNNLNGYLRQYIRPNVNTPFYNGPYYNNLLKGILNVDVRQRWSLNSILNYLNKSKIKIKLKDNQAYSITPQQLFYISFVCGLSILSDNINEWIKSIENEYKLINKDKLNKFIENLIHKETNNEIIDIILEIWIMLC